MEKTLIQSNQDAIRGLLCITEFVPFGDGRSMDDIDWENVNWDLQFRFYNVEDFIKSIDYKIYKEHINKFFDTQDTLIEKDLTFEKDMDDGIFDFSNMAFLGDCYYQDYWYNNFTKNIIGVDKRV